MPKLIFKPTLFVIALNATVAGQIAITSAANPERGNTVSFSKLDDIVVGNKQGALVFRQEVERVDETKREAAQPVPVKAALAETAGEHSAKEEPRTPEMGFLATAADGRALNLDFEKGDLSDWTPSGDAF